MRLMQEKRKRKGIKKKPKSISDYEILAREGGLRF